MEHKQRAKMPAAQRAKQFNPFAAVKGLEKAIAEQEQLLKRVAQIELGEEKIREINQKLNLLEKGDVVSICFYCTGQYQRLQGIVEEIRPSLGFFKVAGNSVPISNICKLEVL